MHEFDKLWNYGDPAGTEAKFAELLPNAEVSGDADYHAQLLTQIARAQGLQGRFADADATLDRAESLLTPETKTARARLLLERGRVLNSSGHPDRAVPLFEQALEAATSAAAPRYAIDAVHMIAIAVADPAEQVRWNLRGIEMAEREPGQKGWLVALLNNIGESYLKLGQYAEARDSFIRLADLYTSRGAEPDMYTVKDIAKAERLCGNAEKSVGLMQPVLERLLAEGGDDGYIRLELAQALAALGRGDEAKPHAAKALEMLEGDEWFMQNERGDVGWLKTMTH